MTTKLSVLFRVCLKYVSFIFFLAIISVSSLYFTNYSSAQSSPSPVTWTNVTNAIVIGSNIQHSGAGYFSKGQTSQTLSGTGYFEFTFNGQVTIVGLGNNNDEANNGSHNDLNFSFNFGSTNGFSIRQNGAYLTDGSASNGDVFRIEVNSSGNIVFKKNGNTICDGSTCSFSNPSGQYPYYLVFKASDYTGSISNVSIFGGSGGVGLVQPTNLQVGNGTGNNINLSWAYSSSNPYSFKIERKLGTSGTFAEIASVSGSARSYADSSGKPANSPFIYRVRAFDGTNYSSYSNAAGAVTPYIGSATISTNRDAVFPYSNVPPLPLAGQKFYDESFGTQIMRLTDETDGLNVATNSSYPGNAAGFSTAYSIWSTFNSNNTKLFVISHSAGSYFFNFDPVNFQRIGNPIPLPVSPSGSLVVEGLIWSRFNPNVFYSVAGTKLYEVTINDPTTSGGQTTFTFNVLRDFSVEVPYDSLRDPYFFKLSLSDDTDDVFWIQVRFSEPHFSNRARMGTTVIVWKKSTNTILYRRDFCTASTTNCTSENKGSIIDKTGRILSALNQSYPSANQVIVDDPQIIDLQNGNSSTTIPNTSPYYQPGHQDLGRGKSVGGSGVWENKIRKWDLVDYPHIGIELLSFRDYSQDTHYSMLAQDDGWVLVSPYVGEPQFNTTEQIKDEVIQVKTDGSGKLRRLLHHYSKAYSLNGDNCTVPNYPAAFQHTCYYATPRATISRDGQYVAFTSNWGNRNGRVDVFIARIPVAPQNPFSDFEGDDKSDITVWRPSEGIWYSKLSSNGSLSAKMLGQSGDIPVASDYDGDGKTDVAVFRNGDWHILQSSNGSLQIITWGYATDKPIPGDYDGDGKSDIAVWRPSNGYWYIRKSSDNSLWSIQWGLNGDIPVHGNFDGDNKDDLAVFRPSTGDWHILRSFDNVYRAYTFGSNEIYLLQTTTTAMENPILLFGDRVLEFGILF